MSNKKYNIIGRAVSLLGLVAIIALFIVYLTQNKRSIIALIPASLAALLFTVAALMAVRAWVEFQSADSIETRKDSDWKTLALIFLSFVLYDILTIALVYALRSFLGLADSFKGDLGFWGTLDSRHYLDIAKDWYLSEGSVDRLVQLVFLPGYPIAVGIIEPLCGNYLTAGMTVSALCFGGVGVLLYKLCLLDMDKASSLRALRYLLIIPGAFFFAAPMSESLFLLLSLGCLYLIRTDRWILGGLVGAAACFTRSPGLALLVPCVIELIRRCTADRRFYLVKALSLLIIPMGFAAYLLINFEVSGDAFKFMQYQRQHWGQSFGFFFNTAGYQMENAVSSFTRDRPLFYGLWAPNIAAFFLSLIIIILGAKRLRASYTLWFLGYFFVAMGTTWLLSAPRYLAAMPVIPVAEALISKDKRADAALSALSIVLSALYLIVFALRYQVW